MAQVTTGLRALLSHPGAYDLVQRLMGARRIRDELVAQSIRVRPGDAVLDLGCGTAEILPHLPEGVAYHGYDISPSYIDAARRRHGSRGQFTCKHLALSDLEQLPRFDVVLAIGVLHHLDDPVAAGFLQLARAALKPHGRFVSIDPCFAAGQHPLARLLIARDRGRNVRTAAGYEALARAAFPAVHGQLRHRRWIPYTHWIMECST